MADSVAAPTLWPPSMVSFRCSTFTLRLHKDLHLLVGLDWWMFSDDEHTRNGSVSGAALSLHRSTSQAVIALLTSGGDRAGASSSDFFSSACCCLLSTIRSLIPAYATAASTAFPFTGGDRVFPDFITKYMPTGLSGLVVAAIFAAAMSSSLNSIAATAVNDLYKPFRPAIAMTSTI